MKAYLLEIRDAVRKRHTREELKLLFKRGTGRKVPPNENLRNYVSKWHMHQQAINNGAVPSAFWKKAVAITDSKK